MKSYRDCVTHLEVDIFTKDEVVIMLIDRETLPLLTSLGSLFLANGYPAVSIEGKTIKVHRLILRGVELVDHINQNKLDNRVSNLREATRSENALNAKLFSSNTHGIKGVYWDAQKKRWSASIQVAGKKYLLGKTEDFFKACCLRKAAEIVYL